MASGGTRSTTWKAGTSPKRTKGTKRKATLIKEAIGVNNWTELQAFVEGPGIKKMVAELMKMNKVSYSIAFLSLLEFVKPKLQRTTVAGDAANPVKSELKITIVKSDVPIAETEEDVS